MHHDYEQRERLLILNDNKFKSQRFSAISIKH